MKEDATLPCPQCKKIIQWNETFPYRPFCSHRCQLIDLGEWASESYKIPVNSNNLDIEDWDENQQ